MGDPEMRSLEPGQALLGDRSRGAARETPDHLAVGRPRVVLLAEPFEALAGFEQRIGDFVALREALDRPPERFERAAQVVARVAALADPVLGVVGQLARRVRFQKPLEARFGVRVMTLVIEGIAAIVKSLGGRLGDGGPGKRSGPGGRR